MSEICLRKTIMHTNGKLPAINSEAPDFCLVDEELMPVRLTDFKNKPVLINVYPSLDTAVCFRCIETFQKAKRDKSTVLIGVSIDTPYALGRIGKCHKFDSVRLLSDFRMREFGANYGLIITDGPLAGFLARAVIVLDKTHRVVYTELVHDIATMPNCTRAIGELSKCGC